MNTDSISQSSQANQATDLAASPPKFQFVIWFVVWLLVVLVGTLVTFILPESFASTARIRVERDATDIRGMIEAPVSGYDPYFIQTEFEVIQSELVLSNVVQSLNLSVEWGRRYAGGERLRTHGAMMMLRGRMDLRPVRNTSLIEIRAFSENPDEAAHIANAIAESYRDHRLAARKRAAESGIQALEGAYDENRERLRTLQGELEELAGAEDQASRSRLETTKAELENVQRMGQVLLTKIAAEKTELRLPATRIVQIVDRATPAARPVRPNKPLNIVMSIVVGGIAGLLLATGIYVLQRLAFRRAARIPRTPLPPGVRTVMHVTIALVVGTVVGYNCTGIANLSMSSLIGIPLALLLGGTASAFIELVNVNFAAAPQSGEQRGAVRF